MRSASEATLIRRRLGEGDFRVGDRIYIEIEATILFGPEAIAQTSNDVQDTVTVLEDSRITVRGIGEISLAGVLRSELQARVTAAVSEVMLNARSTTRPLVRLAVFGSVGRPGYYTVPVETRIDDLVMLAGGPTIDASTGKMRMVRGDTVVLDEDEVRAAVEHVQIPRRADVDERHRRSGRLRLHLPRCARPPGAELPGRAGLGRSHAQRQAGGDDAS